MTFTRALSTNNYGPAKFIVSSSLASGTHTTIAAALTSASSGETIFIRPGTYTENLTLKAGVNLCAFDCDALTPNVIILGTCTFTAAGTVSMSGIQLKTNGSFCLAVTGTLASVVNLKNCFINVNDSTAISLTSSSASSVINIESCSGNIGTTGISLFAITGAGLLTLFSTTISNRGLSSTASTISSGGMSATDCYLTFPITTSTTGGVTLFHTIFNQPGNTTCLTQNSATDSSATFCAFFSTSATAVVITSGVLQLANCEVNSTNAAVISGAGTLVYSGLTFGNSSSLMTVTTQTLRGSTNYQSVNIQIFTASGTYTPTGGMRHCVIECVGGGGGGGGTATSTAAYYTGAGGGGGGGYAQKVATIATIGASQVVTIGAAGTAGAAGNNAGGNGGDTSVGAICIGKGGTGGPGSAGGVTGSNGGAGGVAGTGDSTFPGGAGQCSITLGTAVSLGATAAGGNSLFGAGAAAVIGNSSNRTGPAGSLYGGGGGGGLSFNNGGNVAGAAGAAGYIKITEYIG